MNAPSEQTTRRLFALSANRCAFHNCGTPLVHPSGTITGEICHIKARNPGGPRFDPSQTDAERHAFENLILLCSAHHKVVDDQPNTYTVELLQDIKTMHEEGGNREVSPDDARLAGLLRASYLQANESVSITQHVTGDGNVVAGRDVNINRRVVQKNVVQPGPEHVTESQKVKIKELVNELSEIGVRAGRAPSFGKWWGKFYKQFKVTSYHLLPAADYDAAISWLYEQRARETPKLRRTDNQAWRNHRYRGIWARVRELGISDAQLYALAAERLELKKTITSLTELGEQNLDRLYRVVMKL
ncbi:MAG: hypothetical protein PCFJNLEI_01174 [Verrucomicrobiae bacterium]|nr:hypothetical protein [Verrucomicrobiae bacterium]